MSWMMPHWEDVVRQMGKPDLTQFCEFWLCLFWEGGHERTASCASSITNGPTLILEAVNQGAQERSNVWSEDLTICFISTAYFSTQLWDAMACCLSHSMVVSLRLTDVVFTNWGSIFADNLLALLTEYGPPCLNTINSYAFCNIVSVKAHARHQEWVVFFHHIRITLNNCVERPRAQTRCIPHLRPVITQSLANNRH